MKRAEHRFMRIPSFAVSAQRLRISSRLKRWTIFLFCAAGVGSGIVVQHADGRAAGQPAFLSAVRTAPGGLVLSLQGEPGANYVIESSVDLGSWTAVFTGVSSPAGTLDYTIQAADRARYYLAHSEPALEPLQLAPNIDSSYSAVALLTTNGASLSLTNNTGIVYSFSVPPFAVVEAVPISMTLVTNIGGFPGTNFGTAVAFSPEGLEFYARDCWKSDIRPTSQCLRWRATAFPAMARSCFCCPIASPRTRSRFQSCISAGLVPPRAALFSGVG